MQNPVTGSGGMLVGVVDEVGPESPLGLQRRRPGRHPGLAVPDPAADHRRPGRLGRSLRAGARRGHAILFGRSIAAPLPDDLPDELAMAVMDVCGAPALTARVVVGVRRDRGARRRRHRRRGQERLAVAGGRPRGAGAAHGRHRPGRAPRRRCCARSGLADHVALADARDPVALAAAVDARWARRPTSPSSASTCPAASTARSWPPPTGGTVIFFSMATSFSAAALGAEGLAADVTMLIGNGYVPGHAELALDLLRTEPARPRRCSRRRLERTTRRLA